MTFSATVLNRCTKDEANESRTAVFTHSVDWDPPKQLHDGVHSATGILFNVLLLPRPTALLDDINDMWLGTLANQETGLATIFEDISQCLKCQWHATGTPESQQWRSHRPS